MDTVGFGIPRGFHMPHGVHGQDVIGFGIPRGFHMPHGVHGQDVIGWGWGDVTHALNPMTHIRTAVNVVKNPFNPLAQTAALKNIFIRPSGGQSPQSPQYQGRYPAAATPDGYYPPGQYQQTYTPPTPTGYQSPLTQAMQSPYPMSQYSQPIASPGYDWSQYQAPAAPQYDWPADSGAPTGWDAAYGPSQF